MILAVSLCFMGAGQFGSINAYGEDGTNVVTGTLTLTDTKGNTKTIEAKYIKQSDGNSVWLGTGVFGKDTYRPSMASVSGDAAIPNATCGTITVPATITAGGTTYRVTGIGQSAFIRCRGISKVTLPSSVVTIEQGAFGYCSALKEIESSTVTSIGWGAFLGCSALKDVLFPKATSIGGYAFKDCASLKEYTKKQFPKVASIGDYAFYLCEGINKIEIPNILSTMGKNAFSQVDGLQSLTFEEGCILSTIPDYAFYWAPGLKSVVIPSSIRTIGDYAFGSCDLSGGVTLNEGLETLNDAFVSSHLKSITIPSTVTRMDGGFNACKNLEIIDFGTNSHLKFIGNFTFYNCDALTVLEIPDTVEEMDFTYGEIVSKSLKRLKLPDNERYTTVKRKDIQCPALTELIIPARVTVEEEGIMDCPATRSTTTYALLKKDKSLVACNASGVVLTGADAKVYAQDVTGSDEDEDVVGVIEKIFIQSGTTTIPEEAFNYDYTNLRSVVVPSSVTKIEQGAFRYCEKLEEIDLSGCTNLTSVGSNAFDNCEALRTVKLPNSLKYIAAYMFYHCKNLQSVTMAKDVDTIQSAAFSGCENLSKLNPTSTRDFNLPSGLKDGIIYDNAFNSCSNIKELSIPTGGAKGITILQNAFAYTGITNLVIPQDVRTIKRGAFSNCASLVSIEYNCANPSFWAGDLYVDDDTWKGIFQSNSALTTVTFGPNAKFYNGRMDEWFRGCTALRSIAIPEGKGIKTLHGTFRGCTALSEVTIPSSVTGLSDTFVGCTGLTNITIPSSVTTLYDGYFGNLWINTYYGVFSDCTGLTAEGIVFEGNGLEYVGTSAFAGCTGIDHVNLPNSVNEMEEGCFAYCDSLTEAFLPNGLKDIPEDAFRQCDNLRQVHIPDSVESIWDGAFTYCPNLETVTFGENSKLTYVGSYAFQHCENLSSITLPDTVTSIAGGAFGMCDSLESFDMPNDIKFIGQAAFAYNENMTNVDFSGCTKLETIGKDSFLDCEGLQSVDLSGITSLTEIRDGAFRGCTNLENVDLSGCSNLTTIEENAFIDTNLTNINIDGCSSLTNVGEDAFPDNPAIQNVTKKVSVSGSISNKEITINLGDTNTKSFTVNPGLVNLSGNDLSGYLGSNPYSYQWYKSADGNNAGGTAITGATSASYKPSGSAVGKYYYYCVVTLSNSAKSALEGAGYTVTKSGATGCACLKVTPQAVDISKCTISLANNVFSYDGNEKTPAVTVEYGNKILEKGKDYTLSYSNNINVGQATVKVTGTNATTDDYNVKLSGTKSLSFTITKGNYDLSGLSLDNTTVRYDGKAHKISLKGTVPRGLTVMYSAKDAQGKGTNVTDLKDPGQYTITVEFINNDSNYNDVTTKFVATLTIKKVETQAVIGDDEGGNNTSVGQITVAKDETLEIPLQLKDKEGNVDEDMADESDIQITYKPVGGGDETDTNEALTATYDKETGALVITPKPGQEGQSVIVIVTVNDSEGNKLTSAEVIVEISGQNIATMHQNLTYVAPKAATCTETGNIGYFKCNDEGCAKLFKADNGGNVTKNSITKLLSTIKPLGHDTSGPWQSDSAKHYKECGRCHQAVEKTFAYHNFTDFEDTPSADGSAKWTREQTCSICGYNNTYTYVVTGKKLEFEQSSYIYSGKVITPEAKLVLTISVYDNENKFIKEEVVKVDNTHFNMTSYSNCVNVGTAKVEVGCSEYLGNNDVATGTFEIKPAKLCKVSLSKATLVYTGKVNKPYIYAYALLGGVETGKIANKIKISNSNVYITYSQGCTKVGTYKVTIKGKGNYTGTITKTFKINPKKAVIKSITPGVKKLTVKASTKVANTGATYYQIAYKQKGTTKWKYTTTKLSSKTIKNLKKGKVYYVKMRACKKVGTKTYYGTWSVTKTSKRVK